MDAKITSHMEDHIEGKGETTPIGIREYDEKEVKGIMRKVDWRILLVLTLLYVLSFMDRSNIGNAKVAGMNEELGLTGAQYNMVLTVFFFTYSVFEVPSNVVLRKMKAANWLGILVVSWGTVVTLQGIVQSYEGLLACRIMLGVTEAGFFPAATFLLTCWYSRWQLQTRMALFYSAASLAGSFSGLLAYAIVNMDGVAGLGGWRWIFILEGALTVVVGVTVPFILSSSPETAGFLTEAEKAFIINNIQKDTGVNSSANDDDDKITWGTLLLVLKDIKLYIAIAIYWGHSICVYGFNFAAPTIIKDLGYTAANAQLMTVPIYLFGAISTITFARLADRQRVRWVFIVIPFCIGLVGFIGLLAIPHPALPGVTYFFLFFVTGGLYPAIIGLLSWIANNLAPTSKRAIGMAALMMMGNLGGAIGSNIFLQNQAPVYRLGYGFSFGMICIGIMATFVLRWYCRRLNATNAEMSEDEVHERYSTDELRKMGEKSPLFRFVY